MNKRTDDLIAELAAKAAPVRRLAPPMLRALLWLAVIAVIAGAAILKLSNLHAFAARASDPRFAVELFATLATGLAGVIAAFHLSVPDRARAWALLPAPFAALWIGLSGLGCWRYWAEQTAHGWQLGESAHCFIFLLGIGVPLAGLLLFSLRRAHPLQPRLVASVGTVGVAALAAFILQFFHPFDVTVLDFGIHLTALAILVAVASISGRPALA
jgi:hypothetical protein